MFSNGFSRSAGSLCVLSNLLWPPAAWGESGAFDGKALSQKACERYVEHSVHFEVRKGEVCGAV